MSRKSSHNNKVRARIVAAAAAAFRRDGFALTNIDTLMSDAGLTRGAFYAHFPSKTALFAETVAEDDLLLRLLRGRSAATPDALARGMVHLLQTLLSPCHFDKVSLSWGLPALMRDAALGGADAREAYERVFTEVCAEMARGTEDPSDAHGIAAALCQACGAIAMAAACSTEDARSTLLGAASDAVAALLDGSAAVSGARPRRWPISGDSGQAPRTRP